MRIIVNRTAYTLFVIIIILLVLGFFHSYFNSDSLYSEVFQQDFLRDITLGDRWLQMPASAYFPDQLVYFFSRILFPIQTAFFIVATVKVILLAYAISFFCRHGLGLENTKRYLFAAVTIAIFITPYNAETFSLFRIEMNHFSIPFFALILTGILLKPKEIHTYTSAFTAFFIGLTSSIVTPVSVLILGILGGSILLVKRWEFIKPFPLKSCILRYKALCFKADTVTFVALSCGLISGYILSINFINPGFLGDRSWGNNPYITEHNTIQYIAGKSFNFLSDTYASILLNYVTIFVIITAFFLNNKNCYPPKIKSTYISLMIAFPLTFMGLALTGTIIDINYGRYFYALQILAILTALYVIDKQKNISVKGISLFLVILSFVSYKENFRIDGQQFSRSLYTSEDSKRLASCVDENIRLLDSDKRVVVGVMNYWNANASKVQISDTRIDVFNITPGGGPSLWMQNIYTSNSLIDRFYFAIKDDELHLFPIQEQEKIILLRKV